jgi:hypothetical protein
MEQLIPVFGMITGVLITGWMVIGAVKLMQSPVGIALARRIQGRSTDDEDLRAEVGDLREQVEDMQRQLGEAQERLDFTERLLARGKPVPEEH